MDNLATDVPGAADDENTIHGGPSRRAGWAGPKSGDAMQPGERRRSSPPPPPARSAPARGSRGALGGDVVEAAALAEQRGRVVELAEGDLELHVLGGRVAGPG